MTLKNLEAKSESGPHENDLAQSSEIFDIKWRSWDSLKFCPSAGALCKFTGEKQAYYAVFDCTRN